MIVPPPPIPPPGRFLKWGDSVICTVCQLDVRYCRGHTPPPPPTQGDGAESNLIARIREAQGGR